MQSYTIVIADDHPLVRTGVRDALSPENRYQVIGEASRRYEAFELVRTLQPDLLILDLVMDVSPTAEWLKQCQSVCPHLRILLLSSQTDAKYMMTLRIAPVVGFVLKDEIPGCLVPAVRLIEGGSTYYSQRVTQQLLQHAEEHCQKHQYSLSPRERQVFDLMIQGKENASIARQLGVSIHTVRRCATLIYQKAGFRGRVEAILQSLPATPG